MRKQLFYTFIVFVYIWSWSIFNAVNANERIETTTGHVIVETVKGSDIDQMKILEGELQNLAHKFALEIIPIIEASLPLIMDRVIFRNTDGTTSNNFVVYNNGSYSIYQR